MSLSVWCLVINHDKAILTNPFRVSYDPNLIVCDLIPKVKEQAPRWLKDESAADITAFHSPKIHCLMELPELETALSDLNLKSAHVVAAKLVTGVISGDELLIFQKPAPEISLKRPRTASIVEDEFSLLKRAKIVSSTCSMLAEPSTFTSLQWDATQKVLLDDRPRADAKVAPIGLLYGPFGEFEDVFTSGKLPRDTYVDLLKMEANVSDLAAKMSRYYSDEAEQRDHALSFLNNIFKFKFLSREVDGVWTEGHCDVNGLITTIADFKTSFVGIKTIPHVQMARDVARSHVASNRVEKLCGQYRIPALGISFMGDFVQFRAIILLGHQYRVVGLTPAFSFSLAATNMIQKRQLYHAFIAAHVLQQRIRRDLKLYTQANPPFHAQLLRGEYFFPAITQLRQDGHDSEDKYVKFRILDYHAGSGDEKYEHRHIYRARVDQPGHIYDSQDILVKFCQKYSIDLHKFCSEEGHAPRILGFEQLPGGWFGIAMEYLEDAQDLNSRLSPDQDELLEGLVKSFHTKGLVHGDLRAANILCNKEGNKFWLIDFDWGGKEGEVKYPTWLLNEELRIGRLSKDLIIRQQDDERVLRATLQQLRSR